MNPNDRHYPTSRVTKDGIDISIAPNGIVSLSKKIGENEEDGIEVPASVIFFVKTLLNATRKRIEKDDSD